MFQIPYIFPHVSIFGTEILSSDFSPEDAAKVQWIIRRDKNTSIAAAARRRWFGRVLWASKNRKAFIPSGELT